LTIAEKLVETNMNAMDPELLGLMKYPAMQAIGVVEALEEDGAYRVESASSRFRAGRAASCLLLPEVGDEVLAVGSAPTHWFVLAVLRRAERGRQKLALEGDTVLAVSGGRLDIECDRSLNLRSGTTARIDSPRLSIRARVSRMITGKLSITGARAALSFDAIGAVARLVDAVVGRISTSAKHSSRSVEGLDQVHSGTIDYRAENMLGLHAQHLAATAKNVVKVDGGQIHLG
jgi:hypothetical protein